MKNRNGFITILTVLSLLILSSFSFSINSGILLSQDDDQIGAKESGGGGFEPMGANGTNPPINLSYGWNLVSFPYVISDPSLDAILGSISGRYDRIQSFDPWDSQDPWKHYNSRKPSSRNDLKDLDNEMGFWIRITDPAGASLVVDGDSPVVQQTISLRRGWNLVGYPSATVRSRYDTLNNLDFIRDLNIIQSWNNTDKTWHEMTSYDYFEPGRGYWFHAKRDMTWNLPLEGGKEPLSLSQVQFWAYQLQMINEPGVEDSLVSSNYDMMVLEPTRTDWSSSDREFNTRGLVESLKASNASDGVHRKLVLAYIDIGEAEDWRWYWNWSKDWPSGEPKPADWPDFIICHDPDGWDGNYPVAYWDEEWKDIIIYGNNQTSAPYGDYSSAIDEAIIDGFDGIYLDWVEAFENDDVISEASSLGLDPAVEMINFIQEMRDYANQRNPDFLIVQQNAASLCDGHPELFSKIDAIAQEAIWYDGDATDDWNDPLGYDSINDLNLTNYYLDYLVQYEAQNIPIFNCEYALNHSSDAYTKSYNNGFIPYCSRRSLSQLTTTPPPGY
jgi:cysteinyl-tRNA synthetase